MTHRANRDLCSTGFDPDPMSSAKGDWDQDSNEGDYGGSGDTPRAMIRRRSPTTNLL
jgi:hypothetical protein